MSFWAGVVQGVKDIDVLKEKEALADERKAAADKAEDWKLKTFEYGRKRDEASDAYRDRTEERLLEDRAWTRAQTAAVEVDAANAVLGGARPSAASGGGSGGSGSAPAANDIKDSNIQFNGWAETQLKDEALSSEDADYVTGVVNSFTDPKDAHEFWTLYTGIRESTGQAPTIEQLRNTIRVTQVPGYADNRKQAEEMLAVINGIDATTPEGLLKVRTLRKQLESIDLNAATIDADTSGYVTSEERPKLYEDQAETFETELTTNWLSEEEQNALESAPTPAAATILMSRYRTKYGAQALATLKSEYPREFREAHGNPAFRGIVSADATTTTGSGGTEGGTATIGAAPGDTPATISEKQKRRDALLANPDDPEAIAQANEIFGADAVAKMVEGVQKPYKEYGETRQAGAFGEQVAAASASVDPAELASMEDMLTASDVGQTVTVGSVPHKVEMIDGKPKLIASGLSTKVTGSEQVARMESTLSEGDVGMNFNIEGVDYSAALVDGVVRLVPVGDGGASPRPSADIASEPDTLDIGQTRIPPEDLRTTVSTGDERPVVEGIGDLAKPSALDNVTSPYVTSKGAPLAPEEELAVGIEAIVKGLSGNGMDQAELDDLIIELQEKFGDERVQEALVLAMNQ